MANIKGTNVSSPIVPFSDQDIYPTHEAKYGKGGFRTVTNYEDLDLISMARREEGMLVYVLNDSRNINTYQWIGGEWVRSDIGNSIERTSDLESFTRPTSTMEPGQILYVENEDQFYYLDQNRQWVDWKIIHIGPDAPTNKNAIWIDNANAHYDSSTELLHSFQKELAILKTQMKVLMNIRMAGAVSGKISDGARTDIMSQTINEDGVTQTIIPDALAELMDEEDYEDLLDEDTEEIKPNYAVNAEPTVNHISIKMGTWAEMDANRRNFIDGELIWCTDRTKLYIYINGSLLAAGSGISGGDSEDSTDMTESQIQELINSKLNGVTSIGFIPMGDDEDEGAKYIMRVNSEGKLITYDKNLDTRQPEPTDNYYFENEVAKEGLVINSFYLGGTDNDEHSYQPCSHNFVEIGNVAVDSKGKGKDINLNGFYLCYLGNSVWHKLPLWGVVPAGSTFLIRGAQCSVMNANTTTIKVKTYDMQWYDEETKELIKFDQTSAVFYLAWARSDNEFYVMSTNSSVISTSELGVETNNIIDVEGEKCTKGFIDLVSFNNSTIKEKSHYTLPSGRNASEVIFRRWYPLDPVTQSNPDDGISEHNNKKFLTASLINGANSSENMDIQELTPKASFEGKTISATRTLFNENYPSTLTCTFGIQATDKNLYYTVAETIAYNATLTGAIAAGTQLTTAQANLVNTTLNKPLYSENDEISSEDSIAYNATLTGAIAEGTQLTTAQANLVNTTLSTSYSEDDEISSEDSIAYNATLTGAIAEGTQLTAEQVTSVNTALRYSDSETISLEDSIAYNATLTGHLSTEDVKTDGIGATRCFCWNSVGYYDEYIWYRKITDPSSEWIKIESIKSEITTYTPENNPGLANSVYNSDIRPYYNRVRWESAYGQSVTTHRVLIGGLTKGEYEYLVVRGDQEGDNTTKYHSKTRRFTVRADADVTSFNFVQVTDQQGANWEEYEVWNLSARIIADQEQSGGIPAYDFIINTGDICYNGSRSNEWIDYYVGYEPLDNKEEMFTVGNNDLAPISMADIGNGKESPWKINTYVTDYFYTFEIDPRNPQIFTGKKWDPKANDGNGGATAEDISFKIPSLYSFNYGDFHFISLLSENRTISNKVEYDAQGKGKTKALTQSTINTIYGVEDKLRGDGTNKNASWIYDIEEEWIIKDLLLWKGSTIPSGEFNLNTQRFNPDLVGQCRKCIVFTHEMPFNITSNSAYSNYDSNVNAPRETAKAYLNRYHNYEFQRVFKLWGIPMVIGGHKHTCAITQPVYDAPLGYNPIDGKLYDFEIKSTRIVDGEEVETDPYIASKVSEKRNIVGNNILNDPAAGFENQASFQPFVQVKQDDFIGLYDRDVKQYCQEIYNNSSQSITINSGNITIPAGEKYIFTQLEGNVKPRLRLEVVDNITAPSYVMCQATGFKNKSNSDLAAEQVPWERHYVPCAKNENLINIGEQLFPFYTIYEVSSSQIVAYMYRIEDMYPAKSGTPNNGSPAGYWDTVQRYSEFNTLEENRQAVISKCKTVLYNKPNGTTIVL